MQLFFVKSLSVINQKCKICLSPFSFQIIAIFRFSQNQPITKEMVSLMISTLLKICNYRRVSESKSFGIHLHKLETV